MPNDKSIIASGNAIIRIDSRTIEIVPDDLEWEIQGAEEKQMGGETTYTATYLFNEGDIEWTVWEYPIGVTNHRDVKISGATLVKNFDSLEVNNNDFD